MAKYKIEIKPLAQKQMLEHLKSGNKALIKKIEILVEELSEHPYTGTGQPDPLKFDLSGF